MYLYYTFFFLYTYTHVHGHVYVCIFSILISISIEPTSNIKCLVEQNTLTVVCVPLIFLQIYAIFCC